MTDRAYEPASTDPFEQIAKGGNAGLPTDALSDPDDPFEKIAKSGGQSPTDQSSATGAFARGAERSVLPALGSLPAMGAGAELGGAAGTAVAGPLGTLVGGLLGGAAGAIGGATLVDKIQNWGLSQLPDSWKDKLGLSDRQEQIDQGEHPTASFLGGLAPYALTMRPGAASTTALPENATALQRILAHPVTARLFGGAAMGGMEIGQEKVEDGQVSWPKAGIATAFGVVFNRPTRIGEAITELGARPIRTTLGLPSPTLAQAADAKVMGAGVTEQVFQGAHEQDPTAAMTAQQAARTEQSVLQPEPPPDIHETARRMNPELFAHYDDLLERQTALRGWIEEQGAENAPAATTHLAETEQQIGQVSPEIAAAYRRAAEATEGPTTPAVEGEQRFPTFAAMLAAQGEAGAGGPPQAVPGAIPEAPAKPIEEQRAAIRDDVARQLVAAGRPESEAQAAGALVAARYEARAARFNGALGTAEELYNREGAEIRGAKRGTGGAPVSGNEPPPLPSPPSEQAEPALTAPAGRKGPSSRDPNTFSLLELLASHGGIRSDDPLINDLRTSIGRNNKFVPGFGQLIREPKQLSTAARQGGTHAPMTLDQARELAVHEGYLQDVGEITRGVSQSTIEDLLQAADKELRGQRVYRQGFEPKGREVESEESAHARTSFLQGLDDEVKAGGGEPLTDAEKSRALELYQKEGIHESDAIIERLALEADNSEIERGAAPRPEPVTGWDVAHESTGTPGKGTAIAEGQPQEPRGGAARSGGERDREEELEYFQRKPKGLIEQREAEGQQNIPGTERITQGEQAQRLANEPLKPSVEQKPMDEGLFGTQKDQKELFQQQLGKIRLERGERPIITLAKTADASTFIHETGHQWLEELMRDAVHPQAPDTVKTDAGTVKDWLGVEGDKGPTTRQHEKFARGFEQYIREGVAPSPELASVFGKFRDWLLKIYQTIRGLGDEITPQIRDVFDRMLSSSPQRTVIAPERMRTPSLADIHEADALHTEPTEAEPAMDRVLAEFERFKQDLPGALQNEHAEAIQKAAAESASDAGTETAIRPEPEGSVQPDSGGPEPVAAGGAGGAEPGAERGGSGNAGAEGTPKSASGEPTQSGPDASVGDKPLAPRPAVQFDARESPFVDKAGNIRLENLTNDQDVRAAIRDAASENNDFIGDRRGVVTDGQVMDLAADLGMVGAENLVRQRVVGQAFSAEQIIALRKLLIQSATDVSAAMKKAALGTDEDLMNYAQARARHQLIQGTVSQATAEAGRALRAFRNTGGTEGQADINEFLKQATGRTLFQLRQEAKLGAALESPQQVSKFMVDAQKRTFPKMVLEYWINGLISGPATHATYMIGNTILAAEKAGPETAAAAAIGALRNALGRQGQTVRLGEVAEQFRAGARGVPSAVKAALDAFRTGTTTALPGELAGQNVLPFPGAELAQGATMDEAAKFSDALGTATGMLRGAWDGIISGGELLKAGGLPDAPLAGLRYSHLGAIPDIELRGVNLLPLGTAARLPSRFIAAIHSFFRSVNYSMEKNRLAYRTAMNEGLTGNAFDARMGDLRQNPTDAMMEQARGEATQLTLMGQGGEFTQALSRLTNAPIFGIPIFKFIDPFVHISSNIIEQAVIERTPVGLLSPEIRADLMGRNGNVAQDTATARMLMGTVYAVALGGLAAEGYASGSEPSDPRQAAVWRLAGNQAHSVRVGDMWYDVHRLGPMGMLMGIAADLYDVAHVAETSDMLTAASHLQHAITQNILDESFMRGPSDLIKAVDDPGRYGESYIRNWLSSFVPYSVGMAQMARASDPYSRQARSVTDALKQKIPGMSESLLPRRDIWGEEMPNHDALVAAGVTAIYETRMSRDPVNLALLDLGVYPAQVERKVRNVQLTDDQYDAYSRIAGRMTKMRLDAIVNSPDYRTWPNHIRHDVISEVITQSREAARGILLMKYPQIARDATEAKLKKIQGQ